MDEEVKWTNLTRPHIADLLAQEGVPVSIPVVQQLLEKHHFRKRRAFKTLTGGTEVRIKTGMLNFRIFAGW